MRFLFMYDGGPSLPYKFVGKLLLICNLNLKYISAMNSVIGLHFQLTLNHFLGEVESSSVNIVFLVR